MPEQENLKEQFNLLFEDHMNICLDKGTKDAMSDWWIEKIKYRDQSMKKKMIALLPPRMNDGEGAFSFNLCRSMILSALSEY